MAKENKPRTAQVLDVNANQVASVLFVGHLFYSQGQISTAQKIFEGLHALDSRNPYVHAMLGSIYQKQNAYAKAIRHYNSAINIFPSDIESLVNRGEILMRFGKFNEAAADFKAAVDLDPNGKNSSANRARLLATLAQQSLQVAREEGMQAVLNAQNQLKKDLNLA